MDAIICFHDHGTGFLSRFLKPGFRHCFVAVRNGNYWIVIDGRYVPPAEVVAPADFDLAGFCRDKGFRVIETEQRATARRAPFVTANCVGCAKALLRLRAPFALTPYGLYKHLRRET